MAMFGYGFRNGSGVNHLMAKPASITQIAIPDPLQ
jgi:hypothetical protein